MPCAIVYNCIHIQIIQAITSVSFALILDLAQLQTLATFVIYSPTIPYTASPGRFVPAVRRLQRSRGLRFRVDFVDGEGDGKSSPALHLDGRSVLPKALCIDLIRECTTIQVGKGDVAFDNKHM